MGYRIWVLAEVYGYVVQFEPYQGVKKGKQVSSSTKWVLGETFILRLMECLPLTVSFHILMDNYFTYFRQPTHLAVMNNLANGVLDSNRFVNTL